MEIISKVPTSFLEQWKPLKIIGQGSTCDVILVQNTQSMKTEVVKLFKKELKYSVAEKEAKLMLSLNHNRILAANGFFPQVSVPLPNGENIDEKSFCFPVISVEYAPNGDFLALVQAFGSLPEIISRSYFRQLVQAIEYLHSKEICHLDIKPDNILVDKDYGLKLADFGLSLEVPKDCQLKGAVGTPVYYAPEMHMELKYSGYDSDIFALGITLFIMVSGSMPFAAAKSTDAIYKLIIEERFEEFWQFHKKMRKTDKKIFSDSFRDLIESMLSFNPKKRLSLKAIKDHDWFKGIVAPEEKLSAFVNSILNKEQSCTGQSRPKTMNLTEEVLVSTC